MLFVLVVACPASPETWKTQLQGKYHIQAISFLTSTTSKHLLDSYPGQLPRVSPTEQHMKTTTSSLLPRTSKRLLWAATPGQLTRTTTPGHLTPDTLTCAATPGQLLLDNYPWTTTLINNYPWTTISLDNFPPWTTTAAQLPRTTPPDDYPRTNPTGRQHHGTTICHIQVTQLQTTLSRSRHLTWTTNPIGYHHHAHINSVLSIHFG